MNIDWGRMFETILTVTVPIVILMWKNRTSAKKDSEKKHEQNQNVLGDIEMHLRYFPPHTHVEKSGPLNADGIRRRSIRWDDSQDK